MYNCCGEDEESEGCAKVCKKCDGPWGSGASGCHEKEHNTIEEEARRKPSGRFRRPRVLSARYIALHLSDLTPTRRGT